MYRSLLFPEYLELVESVKGKIARLIKSQHLEQLHLSTARLLRGDSPNV